MTHGRIVRKVRFARDSPLEGDGFEPSVPPCDGRRFRTAGTSADRGFRAGRHGGGVSARHQGGLAAPSSRIFVTDSLGVRRGGGPPLLLRTAFQTGSLVVKASGFRFPLAPTSPARARVVFCRA